jgi:2-Cys peroxiredoxin 5
MKAWGTTLDPAGNSGVRCALSQPSAKADSYIQVRFLGDPTGKFTEALDLAFDSTAIFGNQRSKRYALIIEDGKVKEALVEPDNTGVNGTYILPLCFLLTEVLTYFKVSAAEKVLA